MTMTTWAVTSWRLRAAARSASSKVATSLRRSILVGGDWHDQPVRFGDSLVEEAGAAAACVDHDRAELGPLLTDVLGDVVERVPLDHQVLGDLEALGLGDLEPVVGGLAGGVGVQQQCRQVEDNGVVEGDEPGRGSLAGAALEHADNDHEGVPGAGCGRLQGLGTSVLTHGCLIS
ncbi:hypothetical protein ACQEV2_12190 [Streptomyces sp. CA-251387]|uniref:hypothetical protein n=1 Tax=Streptomyces sp. CA-251387 TaxID=3240064 RepID=UPI003D94F08B